MSAIAAAFAESGHGVLPGMTTRPRSQAGPPMTLGNMRANSMRSLDVCCWQCHHRAILSADPSSDHVSVPSFGPRMVCTPVRNRRCRRPAELAGATGAAERRWHRAMAMSRDQRRALRLLAGSPLGVTEAIMPPCHHGRRCRTSA
jgi:hypothetical protein